MPKKITNITFKIKKITNGFIVTFKKRSKVLEKSYCRNLPDVKELITDKLRWIDYNLPKNEQFGDVKPQKEEKPCI